MLTVIGYEVIVVPAVFLAFIGCFVWCVYRRRRWAKRL
jgi:hypothetical protein